MQYGCFLFTMQLPLLATRPIRSMLVVCPESGGCYANPKPPMAKTSSRLWTLLVEQYSTAQSFIQVKTARPVNAFTLSASMLTGFQINQIWPEPDFVDNCR